MLRYCTLTLFFVLATTTLAQPVAQPAAHPAADADALARKSFEVQTGGAWEKARYFAFTFNVDRAGSRVASFPQRWDRVNGDYSVSGKDPQGREFLVVMNTNTKKGQAWINGAPAIDKALDDMLALAFFRFSNDVSWMLMPLKMLDPGVHRAYDGVKESAGTTYDVVKLTFDGSADQTWAWISRDSGLVEQWHMKLQTSKPDDLPVPVVFHDFKKVGGVTIATRREVIGKVQTVRIDDLVVSSEVPKDAFAGR